MFRSASAWLDFQHGRGKAPGLRPVCRCMDIIRVFAVRGAAAKVDKASSVLSLSIFIVYHGLAQPEVIMFFTAEEDVLFL